MSGRKYLEVIIIFSILFILYIMRICEPAKAYFVILVVYFIIKALFKVVTVQTFIVDLVVALFWTWILSILCRKKMKELAWAFVLLPFVIIGSSFIYGGGVFR